MLSRKRNCDTSVNILDRLLDAPPELQNTIFSFFTNEDFRNMKCVARKIGGNHVPFRFVMKHSKYVWDTFTTPSNHYFQMTKDNFLDFLSLFKEYSYPNQDSQNLSIFACQMLLAGFSMLQLPIMPFALGGYALGSIFATYGLIEGSGYYMKNYLYRTFFENHEGIKSLTPPEARRLKF